MIGSSRNVSTATLFLIIAALLLLVGTVSAAVPGAAFSGTPTSGPAPLTVAFADQSNNSPTGWAWFFGDEIYGEAWTEQTDAAGWTARSRHTSVALPDGSIVLMGGYDGTYLNDVWRSTDNGTMWTRVNASAGWTARQGHTAVALADGSIVLMGGYDNTFNQLNDVWRSTDGGETWTRVTEHAGWTARHDHSSVVMPDGSIVLMGGQDENDDKLNDVWRSTDGGETWTRVTEHAGWTVRHDHASVALPDGSIVLMGGEGNFVQPLDDVWRSTDNGTSWTRQTEHAGWSERYGHGAVVMPDESIVLMGGRGDTFENDVWRSTDNGATWVQLPVAAWSARTYHTAVALPDGSIVLMGGWSATSSNDDVWRFQPAGSTDRDPSHEYDTPGTYSVALQVYNADGYTSMRRVGYITVSAAPVPPEAAFSGTPTSGTAPLAVDFTDESTGSPTAWNWSFGDGEWFNTTNAAEKNPTHTYAAGTYTVNLTVGNAAGNDTHSRSGYITVSAAPVPPEAAFSGSPTSGTAPLAVSFTDESTGDPTGWAWFFGDETYSDPWTEQTNDAGWTGRSGHASVALPDGSIVLMGGMDENDFRNDTWRSDDGGETWTQVNESSGWTARYQHTGVALPDGSIILMGGFGYSKLDDVWRSDDGGATWTQVTEHAGWTARQGHTAVALADGSIILMGGLSDINLNDVWRSTDGGATWMQLPDAGWTARYQHTSVAMPDESIVIMGGYDNTFNPLNDVWRSTDGGTTWTRMTEHAGWSARYQHSSVAMPDESIVLAGGVDTIFRNDVWRSTDGGTTWMQLPDAGWAVRYAHTSVAMPDGSIVLMGGYHPGTDLSDVWRLQPAGSTDRDPSHTYTAPGTYSVALQVYNADGYTSTRRIGYITVSAAPEPTPTARPVHGGGGGGSTGGPDGYNVGGDSAVSMVNVTGTGINMLIVTGWKQSSPGSGIPPAPGIPYQYVDLVPTRFENITGAIITFTVPVAWLEEHGLSPEEIVLYRYNGTAWEALSTTVESTTGTTVTFTATSPGFSLFAITGIREIGEAVTTPTAARTTTQAAAQPTATQTTAAPPAPAAPDLPLPTIAIVAGVVLVLAGGGLLVRRWWIRRQNPALFRDYD